jgi:hypothetical protein
LPCARRSPRAAATNPHIDLANGNAAYAFGSASSSPVGMLVATDGALLVLTQSSIVRFTSP